MRFQHLQQPPPNFLLPPPINMGLSLSLQHPGDQQNQIGVLQSKISAFKDQINQSEKNLSAQEEFFKAKKKAQIDELISLKVNERLNKLLVESNIDLNELEQVIFRLSQACSNEALSVGFMFEN